MSNLPASHDLLGLTVQIVSAHVSHNPIASDQLGHLIHAVYQSLVGSDLPAGAAAPPPVPAVPVKRSVFDDHIVCLEDGKKLKMLKRHLKAAYNLTPQAYRERWGLPPDYPMVAPEYARRRSSLARQSGLGTRTRTGD
jgi:predicted transcriptional regulator